MWKNRKAAREIQKTGMTKLKRALHNSMNAEGEIDD